MKNETLAFLTLEDWQALEACAVHKVFAPGDVIVTEGTLLRNIFILRKGYVRVESDKGITLSQLGAGAVFGEMSWLEQTQASASVIAASEVEADLLEELSLRSLLNSLPGFSSRFYQSLAVTLSQRLRVVSDRLAPKSDPNQRLARTGNISERQIPRLLVTAVELFKKTLHQVEQQLQRQQCTKQQAQVQTATACDQLMAALSEQSQGEALIDSAWSNLLAFRGLDQLESGIGDYVFRELFPWMMQSTTVACCYSSPRGLIDDYEVNQLIYASEAEGDGWLGAALDHWFLATRFCQSRRSVCQQLVQLLQRYEQQPTAVLSLASGAAQELLAVLPINSFLQATLIDQDLMALGKLGAAAKNLGCIERMTLIQNDVLLLAGGQEKLTLPPQQIIYSFGLLDYVTDEQVVLILQWAATQLADQGIVILTNISPEHPDRLFIEHILGWSPNYRTTDELQTLLRAAALVPVNTFYASTQEISWVVGTKLL